VASVEVIQDERLVERSREVGERFLQSLKTLSNRDIKEIRGRGLLIGVELHGRARPYCEKLMKEGILAKDTHESVIRFAPPLVISDKEVEWALDAIRRALKE